MSADALLARLQKVRRLGPGRWMACCPAHDDRHPSLHVTEKEDGTVLLHDFGQACEVADIVAAVGLDLTDLFPPKPVHHGKPIHRPVFRQDVFELIQHEIDVVWLIGCDMHKDREISEKDYQRLGEAAARLERIRNAAYGS